jgi:phosphoenolpyruvate carboxykinase (ATP)
VTSIRRRCGKIRSSAFSTWADTNAYDDQAQRLAGMFVENFAEFDATMSEEVKAAGPRARG